MMRWDEELEQVVAQQLEEAKARRARADREYWLSLAFASLCLVVAIAAVALTVVGLF